MSLMSSKQESDSTWAITALARKFNLSSATSASTDILDSNVTPSENVSLLRVTVSEDTGVVFKVVETVNGDTETMDLNDGAALTPNGLGLFDIPARSDAEYNFQFGSQATIKKLQVDEVPQGAP